MKVGDIVGRRSHNCDVLFRITHICGNGSFILTGLNYRLLIEADESDCLPIRKSLVQRFRELFLDETKVMMERVLSQREILTDCRPGRVLHMDSDPEYLRLCLSFYRRLSMPARGEVIMVSKQAGEVQELLKRDMPDILIITGHDSLYDASMPDSNESYRSSRYFCETVRSARRYNPSKDSLVIIAGACQSNYEALIDSGANIASSPGRILIHALDPVFAAEKIAYTSIDKVLSMREILNNTFTGRMGLGGYQTRGVMRQGLEPVGSN
ncbi:MAG: sporulation peptidase YabG [Clostridiales bacterium]|jgi:spore coat assembly protein|nr:sporulation peptidase YabG [Clostridiales bacterium]